MSIESIFLNFGRMKNYSSQDQVITTIESH